MENGKKNDDEEAERLFLEALENMDPEAVLRDKRRGAEHPAAPAKPRAGKGGRQDFSLDLHRLTLHEAQGRIDGMMRQVLAKLASGPVTLRIITGKGRHSVGSAVLPREIHSYVKSRYGAHIVRIDDSPADLVVGELPLRGHFDVTFGKK